MSSQKSKPIYQEGKWRQLYTETLGLSALILQSCVKKTSQKFRQGIFQGFSPFLKSLEALNSSKCLNVLKRIGQ